MSNEIVGALFFIGTTVATIYIARWILDESNIRRIRMRYASSLQRYAHNKADYWRLVADKAGTYYNQMRNVNV